MCLFLFCLFFFVYNSGSGWLYIYIKSTGIKKACTLYIVPFDVEFTLLLCGLSYTLYILMTISSGPGLTCQQDLAGNQLWPTYQQGLVHNVKCAQFIVHAV